MYMCIYICIVVCKIRFNLLGHRIRSVGFPNQGELTPTETALILTVQAHVYIYMYIYIHIMIWNYMAFYDMI